MKKIYRKTKEGFTLIELLVVVSIISLLSSVVLGGLKSARTKSKNTAYAAELLQLRTALYLYKTETGGMYPGEGTGVGGYDYNENPSYANSLNVLVTNNLIPEIPHHPDWPSNSYASSNPRTYTVYMPNGGGYDYACAYFSDYSTIQRSDLPDHGATIRVITNDPNVKLPGMEPGVTVCYEGYNSNSYCWSSGGPNASNKQYCLGI